MLDLSIVVPTCNRANALRRCLNSIRGTVMCDHEIIVVDGASEDETADVLAEVATTIGGRLQVIREDEREGFVRAANKGFRAARGRCLTWLNDDSRPLPGALDRAVKRLDAAGPRLGFLALFHRWTSAWNVAYEATHQERRYAVCHVRGTLYANFAVGRRATFERLGWFDEGYYFCGADPDLSLKAWDAGLTVAPADGCFIDHDEQNDERRAADAERMRRDNERLFAKWNLPPKNMLRNDFDPQQPCTLRGLRLAA